MSNLSLRHIYKVYPNGVKAVNDFNMEIEDKEFIVFVGPSGCGKSTTLRMIAGLEEITAGELYIGDNFVNRMEPKDRDIAMVFQNYALYPHMTVYENLAFGLRLRHVPQAEIHKKVLWAAKILRLEEYLDRKPKALSGGQRQRVSLGRAILRTPKVFLLDEPLSNLDAKLRTEMRAEIAKLHNELNTTFIYVTHDQVEAMTMGTRIVVMSMGYVQQIDTPQNLYNYPENKFVAGFIGTPQMNFFNATLKREGDIVKVKFDGIEKELQVPFGQMLKVRPEYLNGDKKVIVGLRCEHLSVDPEIVAKSDNIIPIKISIFEELGNETLIYGDMNTEISDLADSGTRLIVKQYGGTHESRRGDIVNVAFDMSKAHFFDAETEQTIAPRIPVDNVFDVALDGSVMTVLGTKVTLPKAVAEQVGNVKTDKASLLIPTNALYEGGNDLVADVVAEETIKGTLITHLQIGNRTFFMLNGSEHTVGDRVTLGIDFKKISVSSDGDLVVRPLPEYDTFYGPYFDKASAQRSSNYFIKHLNTEKKKEIAELSKQKQQELAGVVLQPEVLQGIKAEYADKRKEIQGDLSFQLGTQSLGKEGKKKVKAEADAKLTAAKKEFDERVAQYNAEKAELEALSESEKAIRAQKEQEVNNKYNQLIAQVEEKYRKIVAEVNDNIPKIAPMLTPIEEERLKIANEKLSQLNADYTARREQKAKELSDAVNQAKAKVETSTGTDRDVAVLELKEAKIARKDRLAEMQTEYNLQVDDVLFESKVFVAYINGRPFVTTLDINKKIVKGLGAQLFLSHYRYEVPHDAYVANDDGINVTVEDIIDYGTERYAKCSLHDSTVYVKVDKEYKQGDKLSVDIDIEKARIYENMFDIRLY